MDVLNAGAVEIRDVDRGEKPFLYSSGHWGPGYVMIKGLVGRKGIIKSLAIELTKKIVRTVPHIDFVAGNVSGGVVPGWLVSEHLETLLARKTPFVYVRETRKKGGQKEHITGLSKNPEIPEGANALVVEELVNFASTTCNSAAVLRDSGYTVTHAACILFYENPESLDALKKSKISMCHLFTLSELLEVAEQVGMFSKKAINDYRSFLKDPLGWEATHGLKPVETGGTK